MNPITNDEYKYFLKLEYNYDNSENRRKQNSQYYRKSIKEFLDYQVNQCEMEGKWGGNSVNIVSYFLARFQGAVLTCRNSKEFHCAFIYERDGGIYVCDPTMAIIDEDAAKCHNMYFDIPIHKYHFGYDRDTIYTVNFDYMRCNPDNEVYASLLNPRFAISKSDLAELTEEEITEIKNILNFQKVSDEEYLKNDQPGEDE